MTFDAAKQAVLACVPELRQNPITLYCALLPAYEGDKDPACTVLAGDKVYLVDEVAVEEYSLTEYSLTRKWAVELKWHVQRTSAP